MLLTLKDVSTQLQCSTRFVQYMVERGELTGIQLSERNIRVHPDDLEIYIRSKQKEANLKCEQLKIQRLDGINSGSVIPMENNNNSRRKRISQRALHQGRPTK